VPLDSGGRGRARLQWLQIFGGAAAGGLLLSVWLPSWLDDRLTTATSAAAFSAAFFVFLNLHHYLIDASIWRSNGELVRSMTASPAAVPAAGQVPAPA
jgi:divalent metal cation (Fe/Co/Zn/Cd) transporter